MTHIITSLCVRDRGCIDVCPVECMVPGQPVNEWPWIYIDPDTCIDCGACVPECPFAAIFPEDEVPSAYTAKGGEYIANVKTINPDIDGRQYLWVCAGEGDGLSTAGQ